MPGSVVTEVRMWQGKPPSADVQGMLRKPMLGFASQRGRAAE